MKSRKTFFLSTLLSAIGLLSFTSLSHSALLLYDGLDYEAQGDDLSGNTGGSSGSGANWDGAWIVGQNNGNDEVSQVLTGGLNYGQLVVGGNATQDNNGGDSLGNARAFTGVSTADGTSLWFSSLIDPVGSGSKLYNGWFTRESKLNGDVGFGWILEPASDTTATITPYVSGGGTASDSFTFESSEAILIVGRIDFSDSDDSDDLRLWVNPAIGNGTPTDASATASFLGQNFVGGSEYFAVGGNNGGEAAFDEFRLGESFGDVTPIPEPSAFTLILGCTGLLFLLYRRR